jgi:uncharacterized protein (DUF58 family)
MADERSRTRFPLDAAVLQRLDSLTLLTRRPMATGHAGRRRSPLAGSSIEFADYRRYSPGDDFRRIDWRAYARLERLFLRVFEAEENLTVSILLDSSGSMHYGTPSKLSLAITLAAALAYIAIKCEDNVILGALTDRIAGNRRIGSGKNAIWSVGEFLNQLPHSGTTDLNKALYDLGRIVTAPGLTIVISDFLAPDGYQTGIRALRQFRQEVALLQILSPDEIEPEIQGDWRLRDSEDHETVDVSISAQVLQAYRQRLAAFTQALASFAHAQAISYTMISSSTDILDVIQRLLRQIELVK